MNKEEIFDKIESICDGVDEIECAVNDIFGELNELKEMIENE